MKKISLGEGGVQALMAKHAEKAVFGICVLLVLVFVYTGFSLESYNRVPKEIADKAQQARQQIDRDSWEAIQNQPERLTATNYEVAVKEGNIPTRGSLYAYEMPLKIPLVPSMVKRSDPELYAPVRVVVRSMNAPIAIKNETQMVDKLDDLKSAEPPPEKKPKPKKEKKNPRQGGMPMPGMAGGGMPMPGVAGGDDESGMPGGGMPMPGLGSRANDVRMLLKPEGWRPLGSGGMPGMGGGMPMPGMGGGGMPMPGMGGGGMPMPGMGGGGMPMPGMAGSSGAPGMGGDGADGESGGAATPLRAVDLIAQPARIVSVMALIPYEKQVDEYKRVFETAYGYNPLRDRPNYIWYVVERAEVTDDPNAELDWVRVGSTGDARKLVNDVWGGVGTEVANSLFTLPDITMEIPPILLRDFESLALHPDIPAASQKVNLTSAAAAAPVSSDTPSGSEGDIPSDIPTDFGPRRGAGGMPAMGGMPMPGMGGGGMPMPGMGGGGMPMPGMGGGGMPMPGMGGGGMPMPGMGGGGMPMPGMGGGGMPMPGMSGSYSGVPANVTEWKLLRYFDFTAEPGKVYRYRVQLLAEDPNHPKEVGLQVPPRTLDDAAAARLAKVQAAEKERKRIYYRYTPWSEPSDPISLPPAERFFAGGPENKTLVYTDKNGAELYNRPPEARVVGVYWDEDWGLDLTYDKVVEQGTVVNYTGDIEAVHPLSLEFKVFEDYDLRTNACVADVRGGVQVGGDSVNPLLSPMEYAIVDAQGNLHVRMQLEDLDRYRRYAYVEEENESGSGGGPPGMGGGGPPGMGGGGPPGMSGGGPPGMGGPAGGTQNRGGNRRNR